MTIHYVNKADIVGNTQRPAKRYRHRKPTLASVAKQANAAHIEVARYEIEPGKIILVPVSETAKVGNGEDVNPWDKEIEKLQ